MKNKLLSDDLNFLEITLICIKCTRFVIFVILKPFFTSPPLPGRGQMEILHLLGTTVEHSACRPSPGTLWGEGHTGEGERAWPESECSPKILPGPAHVPDKPEESSLELLYLARWEAEGPAGGAAPGSVRRSELRAVFRRCESPAPVPREAILHTFASCSPQLPSWKGSGSAGERRRAAHGGDGSGELSPAGGAGRLGGHQPPLPGLRGWDRQPDLLPRLQLWRARHRFSCGEPMVWEWCR